jgi:hypothetical protein
VDPYRYSAQSYSFMIRDLRVITARKYNLDKKTVEDLKTIHRISG